MQHSVKSIGENHAELSNKRSDAKRFNAEDFFAFAKQNISKYSLIENGDDLLVSTWYSNDLIEAYRATIVEVVVTIKVVRVIDNKVMTVFIPNAELGAYKSALLLTKQGYTMDELIDNSTAEFNPVRFVEQNEFEQMSTRERAMLFWRSTPTLKKHELIKEYHPARPFGDLELITGREIEVVYSGELTK